MSVEATASKYKANSFRLYMAVCIIGAVVLAYDGYLSKYDWAKRQKFYETHYVLNDNQPDGTMTFNMNAPFVLLPLGIFFAFKWVTSKKKKVVAGDTSLDISGTEISYDSMESINKTHFDSKGFFMITYKDSQGSDNEIKISDRDYDGLGLVLDEVVAKIS
jgi:hypothetical protein